MTTLNNTMLAKIWISREEYLARRHLDDDARAVLMTYTHNTNLDIYEDDLFQAVAAAAAALNTTPPEMPEYPPLETELAMLDLAAHHWTPDVPSAPSRWHGDEESAREMLALACAPETETDPPQEQNTAA